LTLTWQQQKGGQLSIGVIKVRINTAPANKRTKTRDNSYLLLWKILVEKRNAIQPGECVQFKTKQSCNLDTNHKLIQTAVFHNELLLRSRGSEPSGDALSGIPLCEREKEECTQRQIRPPSIA
jgi:hypothetical protein